MKHEELTTKDYFRAGALIRICQYILDELWSSPTVTQYKQTEQNVYRMLKAITVVRFQIMTFMCQDFPCLKDDRDMFFVSPDSKPRTREEMEVIAQMKQIIEDMLGDNIRYLGE